MYNLISDINEEETNDWLKEIDFIIKNYGLNRSLFIIKKLLCRYNYFKKYKEFKICSNENYINTIHYTNEKNYPGDIKIEEKIESYIKWNSLMIVLRSYKKKLDLGGHISSYQSSSTIYEVCFNHFFKSNINSDGDLVFFQGHISPGIYSRAFIENRLNENNLDNFRQELLNGGLSSYPHPRLMKDFWEFPTVSMGLAPVNSIYHAKFLKYLENRNICKKSDRTVYAFLGDGEMDEPESRGLLYVASRNKLDNLIFIINCNLQRLDGLVYGNGKIIFELEKLFKSYNWKVIKVILGCKWDNILDNDKNGLLIKLLNETNDGNFQNLFSKNGNYIRKNFFEKYNETKNLVENMTDDEIYNLNFGGHDRIKIFNAIYLAKKSLKPCVILFHSIKGYGINEACSKNISHQIKYLTNDSIKLFRNFLNLNDVIKDNDINNLPYIKFDKNSSEFKYLTNNRKKLKGYIPNRNNRNIIDINIPNLNIFKELFKEQTKNISTTMCFYKILYTLLKDNKLKNNIVPIVADEARTFGLEPLFDKIGIYNPNGQKYISQDEDTILRYKESKDGQILQEGINELGALSSWISAGTSYSVNNITMIPFYIFYSIFGFQRVCDLTWAASDQMSKGFLIGATSGRTTLNGEGLQHSDGHSHIFSLTIPNCVSYNPSYGYELAIIIHNGIYRMYKKLESIYYYITVCNENYYMPPILDINNDIEEGICKGIYLLKKNCDKKNKIQLLGSGSIINNVIKASEILLNEYNISSYIYSVTSFTEIYRDGKNCSRWNMLNPDKDEKIPYVKKILLDLPIVASTDYIKLYADQIREFLPSKYYYVLGTDGFGLSDSRKNLRNYFEIDEYYIVVSSLYLMYKSNLLDINIYLESIKRFKIDINKINPIII